MKPFTVHILASSPTLAMGISFFIWIPLSVGFGRRPILLLSALVMTCATVGAGFAPSFHHLLASLICIGFSAGATLSTVRAPPHLHSHALANKPHRLSSS